MMHLRTVFFIILLSLLISGCVQKTYRPLSDQQINQFIAEQKLTPLSIRNFENYTIILSKNQICSASVDENGEMGWACSSPVIMNDSEPVSINNLGSLVAITIHDAELLIDTGSESFII